MKFTWRTEWPLWVLLAGMFLLAAVTWPNAPDRIPVRWSYDGEVGYAGKFEGLFVIPLIALASYFLFRVLPRIDPARANYAHFAGAYTVLRFAVLLTLALVYGVIHLWIRGHQVPVGLWIPMILGGAFIAIGGVFGKLQPNWFVGLRTPWTLSSERAWTQAHRVAGWVFMLVGVCLIVAGAIHSEVAFIATIVVAIVGILGTIAYSYFVWRDDPGRRPPGRLPAG